MRSGECAGCGVLLDEAGIIMEEPADGWVRQACGPWIQECCGECHLPLSYWRLMSLPADPPPPPVSTAQIAPASFPAGGGCLRGCHVLATKVPRPWIVVIRLRSRSTSMARRIVP
jgi:hypothetical protein